jgi:hypothetical protein
MLPLGDSPYLPLFRQGASLVPRRLILVETHQVAGDEGRSLIRPPTGIQAKAPWDTFAYAPKVVEATQVFPVARSIELLPFVLVNTCTAFLPLDQDTLQLCAPLPPLAAAHWTLLSDYWTDHKKRGAAIDSLWDRLNYNSGITHKGQAAPLKVIFPAISGGIKGALVRGPVIIDTSLYYMPLSNEAEGYYLLAFLNSPSMAREMARRGSTGASGGLRNIHKKPLEVPIPLYDPHDAFHRQLEGIGRALAGRAEELTDAWLMRRRAGSTQAGQGPGLRSLGNQILAALAGDLRAMDDLVVRLLRATNRND